MTRAARSQADQVHAEPARPQQRSSAEDEAPRHLAALATEPWPRGVSRRATMSIGAVLGILKNEFPAVSLSKIRFLENQGLVQPQRTPAGYRMFSDADVERLRFALAAQRDSFMPLRVIGERLAELDAGLEEASVTAAHATTTSARLRPAELAELAGVSTEHLAELTSAGLVGLDAGGRYPTHSVAVVQLAAELGRQGVDLRHLRQMRSAADRQVDVVAQLTAPLRGRPNSPQDSRQRERALEAADELSGLLSRLHSALVSSGVERLF